MEYAPDVKETYVTHLAVLMGKIGDEFVVNVKGAGGPVKVSVKETLELNQPHIFAYDVKGDLEFEDKLIFATKGIMEKSKLLEMSFKLAPVATKMNFNSPDVLKY